MLLTGSIVSVTRIRQISLSLTSPAWRAIKSHILRRGRCRMRKSFLLASVATVFASAAISSAAPPAGRGANFSDRGPAQRPVTPASNTGLDRRPTTPTTAGSGLDHRPITPTTTGSGLDRRPITPGPDNGLDRRPISPGPANGLDRQPIAPAANGLQRRPVTPGPETGLTRRPVTPGSAQGLDRRPVAPGSAFGLSRRPITPPNRDGQLPEQMPPELANRRGQRPEVAVPGDAHGNARRPSLVGKLLGLRKREESNRPNLPDAAGQAPFSDLSDAAQGETEIAEDGHDPSRLPMRPHARRAHSREATSQHRPSPRHRNAQRRHGTVGPRRSP